VETPTLTLELRRGRAGFAQRLADEWLWSDLALGLEATRAPRPALPPAGARERGPWRKVLASSGEVAGRELRVGVERNAHGDRRLEFEDGERYWIARAGDRIRRLAGGGARPAPARLVERALGAPLALALAPRGVHLLHASAVAGPAGALALVGDSGAGKSTLAAAAVSHPEAGLERLADDILPVRLGGAPRALPSYPQLKLAEGARSPAGARFPVLPLLALFEVEHGAGRAEPELVRLPPAAAVAALVRATVAARLFDEELLGGHFAAAAAAAEILPVYRLRFPSGRAGLAGALAVLAASAGSGGAPAPDFTREP
jgi:hypothetical protein